MNERPRTAPSHRSRLRALPRPTLGQAGLIALLLLLSGLVTWRIFGLIGELRAVKAAHAELEDKRAALEDRHKALEAQADFVADPDNLEQELRSRFNYKRPGEKVIVVVPPKSSSTTSTDE